MKPIMEVPKPPRGMPPELAQMAWDDAKKEQRKKIFWANLGVAWNTAFTLLEVFFMGQFAEYGWRLFCFVCALICAFGTVYDYKQSRQAGTILGLMEDKEREWKEVGNRPW